MNNYNYRFVGDQAYTEDHVLIYNIFVYNIRNADTEDHVLQYFQKFGKVLKVKLVMDQNNSRFKSRSDQKPKIGFVNFADSKIAAKVLENCDHVLNGTRIGVKAGYSWTQPNAHTAQSLHASGRNVADAQSAGIKTSTETCKSLCSSSSPELDALILNLNDDCLEHICKNLELRDQINFARACPRFRDVFTMLSKVVYKIIQLEKISSLTLWQIREFLKMSGPHIETLKGKVLSNDCNRIVQFLSLYCTNVKTVDIYPMKCNPVYLRQLESRTSNLSRSSETSTDEFDRFMLLISSIMDEVNAARLDNL